MHQLSKTTVSITKIMTFVFSLPLFVAMVWSVDGNAAKITLKKAQHLARAISKQQKIPVKVDHKVLYQLNKYMRSGGTRLYTRRMLKRMKKYEGMIKRKMRAAGLPPELIAVAMVESGFRANARSKWGPRGMWQFKAATARSCGLKVNKRVDERLNPSRLTDAAVCYYKRIYKRFGHWHTSLVAYYTGEPKMKRVLRRAGHRDIMKLSRQGAFGKGASAYLPKILASMIIIKNPHLVK